MTHLIVQYGLVILFLLVAMESAGVPLPGETALVTAAVLAKDHWGIEWVIVVAAAGAIVGDNIGYWLGRLGGRKVIERYEITRRYADRALPPSERFFKKHGGKTIFLARFIAVLRVTAAWIVWREGRPLSVIYPDREQAETAAEMVRTGETFPSRRREGERLTEKL